MPPRTSGPGRNRGRPTRRQFAVRRLCAALVVLTAAGLVTATVYALDGAGAGGHPVKAVRVIPPPTAVPSPPAMEPAGGSTLFPSHRLVAFYGAPDIPRLGVLGTAPPESLWPRLMAAAAPFASPQVAVVPTYELITFMAQAAPGSEGAYAAQIPASQIDSYLQVVHAHGGLLILDIQPGRTDLLADAQALEPWLTKPDVGLALDPEWELEPGQVPNKQIGRTNADEINRVSAWLDGLTAAHRLPQKLLIIHQFRDTMVESKAAVVPRPNLALAFNMDGFGTTANKLSVYQLLASDPRWTLGYKLFYTRDRPLQTPADVLALAPPPQIIEYE